MTERGVPYGAGSSARIHFALTALVPEVEALANIAKALEGIAGDLVPEVSTTRLVEATAVLHAGIVQVSVQAVRIAIATERLAVEARFESHVQEGSTT